MDVLLAIVFAIIIILSSNWLGTLFFTLMSGVGAAFSIPLQRLTSLMWLALFGGWAWLLNNIFAFALAIGVAGTFLNWGVAQGAITVSWWAFGIASVLYFLSGIGSGIAQARKRQMLEESGMTEAQMLLLSNMDQQRAESLAWSLQLR